MKQLLVTLAAVLCGLVAQAQAVIGLEDWKIYEESIYDNSVYLPKGDSLATVTAKYFYQKTALPVPGVQQPVVTRNGRQAVIRWTRTKGLPQSGIVQILVNGALRYAANVYVGKGPSFLVNAQLPTRLSQFVNDLKLQTAADVQAIIGGKFNTADTSRLVQKMPGKSLFSGRYGDLIERPTLFSGRYTDLSDRPALFSGRYTDLTDRPVLFSGKYGDLTDRPVLFSGNYDDLTNRPATFSANYNDLANRPSLGTMSGQNAGTVAITGGSVYLPAYDLYNAQMRVGALEMQGVDAGVSYLMQNAHYEEGNGFKRRYSGAASLFAFLPGEGQFRFAGTGFGYSLPLATKSQMKIGADGSFGIGGAMPPEVGDYSGSALYVKGASRNVLIGTTIDEPSAILNISSTTQGVLLPSLTNSQINAISIPKKGLLVFNTDLPGFQFWNGSQWKSLLTN